MKLHIFGASGSGVTTLGKALAEKLGIEYFDSDDFFWLKTEIPFTQKRDPGVRNKMISSQLHQTQDWVFGGSVIHWGKDVFPTFNLIIFLYLPPDLRLERVRKREYERYGDEITVNPERAKLFEEFMNWTRDYDDDAGIANRTLNAHRKWLSSVKVPLLELSGNYDVPQKIEIIMNRIKEENLL